MLYMLNDTNTLMKIKDNFEMQWCGGFGLENYDFLVQIRDMVKDCRNTLTRVERVIDWYNSEVYNELSIKELVKLSHSDKSLFIGRNNKEIISIDFETKSVNISSYSMFGFDRELKTMVELVKETVKDNNVIYRYWDSDEEYTLFNLLIFDRNKFKKSDWVVFNEEGGIISRDYLDLGSRERLHLNPKLVLCFSNKFYVDNEYIDKFKSIIKKINEEDVSIKNKVKGMKIIEQVIIKILL